MAEELNSKCALPASPNWYCSSGSDYSLSDVYAFAAKKCVYLFDVSGEVPLFKGQFTEHTDRVSSVKFCPHGSSNLCVSGADDKSVRLWDVESRAVLASHTAHKAKVTSLSWSPVAPNLILSGDEKGLIIAWCYDKNIVYSSCPVQEYVFSVAASSVTDHQVAVGYKNGLIIILQVNEQGMSPLHRLRGHDGDIQSIAWCPIPVSQLDLGPLQKKAEDAQGYLLISGSRDQTIRLWDTLNGKLLSVWSLPKRASQRGREKQLDWQSKDRLWVSVSWPPHSNNKIVSSSHGGELLLWDLGASDVKEQVQTFGQGHSRIVFNISSNPCGTKIITTSMDRQVILWDAAKCRSICTLPTLGGFVYAMAISPLNPGTLALGVGDNMIRVWQTSSSLGPYDALTFWQGIKAKVMMVRWHPHKEGLLAFATDDGQVGIYNILSKGKPEVFASYHKKTVYSLSWGPPCPAVDSGGSDKYHLYSCGGEGIVLEHRPGHPLADAADINALIKTTNDIKRKLIWRTDVVWSSDGMAMALGNDDGYGLLRDPGPCTFVQFSKQKGHTQTRSIEIFVPPSLHQICIISVHKKSITCLAWNHGYGETSTDEGSFKYWLASGSNESAIHVYDLSKPLASCDSVRSPEALLSITTSTRQLIGHSGRVTALSWSPHHSDRLVSSSYDGSAQVWDVMKSQPLANFRGHVGRVMSVCWSYLDPDVIYSGGEDGTARPWKISEQTQTHPPSVERYVPRSKSSKNKKKAKGKGKEKEKIEPNELEAEALENKTEENSSPMARVGELAPDMSPSLAEASVPEEVSSSELFTRNTPGITSQMDSDGRMDRQRTDRQDAGLSWRAKPREMDHAVVPLSSQAQESTAISPMDMDWRVRPPVGRTLQNNAPLDHTLPYTDLSKGAIQDRVSSEIDALSVLSADDDTSSSGTVPSRDGAPFHFVPKTKSETNKKKKKVKSMFPLSAVADNRSKAVAQQECVSLARFLNKNKSDKSLEEQQTPIPGQGSLVNLGFFADRNSAYKMLIAEGAHHNEGSNIDYQLQLEVWKGNLGGALEIAARERQLCDWLVALSPLAGNDVWLATAEMFADQLATQGVHHRAVLYYLACHKVYTAIDVYKNQAMFREAIALAKARLCPADPVLHDLYTSWAKKLETENAFEQAAKCYLAVHLPADAVRILSTRGDMPSLLTALQIALICDLHQLASSLAVRVLSHCLGTGNWSAAQSAMDGCRGIEGHLMALCVHEVLIHCFTKKELLPESLFSEPSPSKITSKISNGENNFSGESLWFVKSIMEAWEQVKVLPAESAVLCSAVQQVKSHNQSCLDENLSVQKLVVRISYDIAHALLCGVLQDLASCVSSLLNALQTCIKNCQLDLAKGLCDAILPEGSSSLEEIVKTGRDRYPTYERNLQPSTEMGECVELYEYVKAYYQSMVLYKVWWRKPEVLAQLTEDVCPEPNGAVENLNQEASEVCENREAAEGIEGLLSGNDSDSKIPTPSNCFKKSLHGFLDTSRAILLDESLAEKIALKKQLSEVKKTVVLLRSKKILESVAVGKGPGKKKDARPTKTAAKGSVEKSTSVVESEETFDKDGACDVLTGRHIIVEEASGFVKSEASSIAVVDNNRKETSDNDNRKECVDQRLSLVQKGSPLDKRYQTDDWTLEGIEVEEQRLLQQLCQHKYQDFPSPDPIDAAMVMGYLCSHPVGLNVCEPAVLYRLGLEISQWALDYAQWDVEITCLRRLVAQCSRKLQGI